jgi:hypothetical protein
MPQSIPQIDSTPIERMKARIYVQAVEDAVLAVMRENAQLFGWARGQQGEAFDTLADNLWYSDWVPDGLEDLDVRLIGRDLLWKVVWAVADGRGLAPVESRVFQVFSDETPKVPAVRELEHPPRPRARRAAWSRR